uniref:Alpha-glucan water dikinaseic-like isoform X3 n=1 Tax=Rhizophora mucronata TaxID=61149 RepID=A0A2P2LZQ2_RHIMU
MAYSLHKVLTHCMVWKMVKYMQPYHCFFHKEVVSSK